VVPHVYRKAEPLLSAICATAPRGIIPPKRRILRFLLHQVTSYIRRSLRSARPFVVAGVYADNAEASPLLDRYRLRLRNQPSTALDATEEWAQFGSRRSEVQILSPRLDRNFLMDKGLRFCFARLFAPDIGAILDPIACRLWRNSLGALSSIIPYRRGCEDPLAQSVRSSSARRLFGTNASRDAKARRCLARRQVAVS
jgi:hypothetical protein